MNEMMARSLTVPELAKELRYHPDPGVSRLATAIDEGDLNGVEVVSEEIRLAEERAEEVENELSEAKAILTDCLDELSDISTEPARELVKRIKEVL